MTGRQTPTKEDIAVWVAATSGEQRDADALSAMLETLESAHAEWQRLLRGGVHHHQGTWADMERKTTGLRVFEPAHVPGLLQTADYARRRLAEAVRHFRRASATSSNSPGDE